MVRRQPWARCLVGMARSVRAQKRARHTMLGGTLARSCRLWKSLTASPETSCQCVTLPAMTARLSDIAAQAQVSEATVSRVLNDKPGVAPDKRQAVLTALDVLGYERPTRLRKRSA